MDEKERQNIKDRSSKFNRDLKNEMHIEDVYTQGALDQDPISRKKRTEEIIQELESYVDGHMDAPVVTWCIEKIKALP